VSAFPRECPADLDDLDTVAAHDWSEFQALSHVDTHWQRPGWTPGRSSYHWMLTFEGHPPVIDHVLRCRPAVPSAGYDLAAADSVHLTIGRIGFTDDLSDATARVVARSAIAADSRPRPFDMVFGPLTGSRGAIRFSVGPWSPLLALHAFLAGVTRGELGERCAMDTATFRPHVSIAYAHTRIPAATVASRLRGWREVAGPTVRIDAVGLVCLERVERSYRYRTLERVPLSDIVDAAHSCAL
jgi:2'-5' RNA ligase